MFLVSSPDVGEADRAQHSARRSRPMLALVLSVALTGCATTSPPSSRGGADAACQARFVDDDLRLAAAGALDAQAWRVPGHPWLRSDRLLASFTAQAATPVQRRAWLARAGALDAEGRALEHARLARAPYDAPAFAACRAVLGAAILADDAAWARLGAAAARVPDAYSTARRLAGLYVVSARLVLAGVRALQRDLGPRLVDSAAPAALAGEVYAPPVLGWPETPPQWAHDALGVPHTDAATLARLFARHAPQLVIETRSADDRPGAITRADPPYVAPSSPTVYTRLAYTRLGDRVLAQLVYTWWFAARTPRSRFDGLAGPLDGLTWRVTLDADGAPLAYDVMHNCGCYHMFFPTPRLRARSPAAGLEEAPWIPFTVPATWPTRLRLGLAAGSHYLTALAPGDTDEAAPVYALRDYRELRALPGPAARQSLFDARGLVPGSARGERWWLWPMGVIAPGSMRQWGHHATAFVGRRHFDEARLLERYFTVVGAAVE